VRILSVADVYDAMASVRPYRAALPHEQCLELLRDNAQGGGLDPDLVPLFIDDVLPTYAPVSCLTSLESMIGGSRETLGDVPQATPCGG